MPNDPALRLALVVFVVACTALVVTFVAFLIYLILRQWRRELRKAPRSPARPPESRVAYDLDERGYAPPSPDPFDPQRLSRETGFLQ